MKFNKLLFSVPLPVDVELLLLKSLILQPEKNVVDNTTNNFQYPSEISKRENYEKNIYYCMIIYI